MYESSLDEISVNDTPIVCKDNKTEHIENGGVAPSGDVQMNNLTDDEQVSFISTTEI